MYVDPLPQFTQNAIDEYMKLSQEIEDANVAYMKSLSEKEFLDELLSTLNDPEAKMVMIIAIVRESVIQRKMGLPSIW